MTLLTGRCKHAAGKGYGRKLPFEHIYRHHRRYRITEGSEEIQIRKVAGKLFGFAARAKG
ncbi:MAG: acyl-CoA dehydrogenase family protein [Acidimicrobiales bacterium]